MTVPRLLVIMGSGETSPTMVKTHRRLFARLGPPPVPAVLLDTPFGFQENASEIAGRAVEYFRQSVGQDIEVASYRSAGADVLAYETMLARLREARYAFSGPGSPTYALRQWSSSSVPSLLGEKLRTGGCVVFASAAAVTLGSAALPVYEIYKVGEDPRWLPGLDLLGQAGLQAAVIPHYNNAEGGTHDTRYCYLGERRLRAIEGDLPGDAFVLGVDEHTGCVLDLDAGSAEVVGLGVVTVRAHGRSRELATGTTVPIASLGELAQELAQEPGRGAQDQGNAAAAVGLGTASAGSPAAAGGPGVQGGSSPLLDAVDRQQAAFDGAVDGGDVPGAVRALLELDEELAGWSWDTLQSDERDRARSALRSLVVRLGEMAEGGGDPHALVAPFVEALLDLRARARAQERWDEADAVRRHLVALGIEVHDTPGGSTWKLAG